MHLMSYQDNTYMELCATIIPSIHSSSYLYLLVTEHVIVGHHEVLPNMNNLKA